jgi:hypothetical protein
MTVSLIVMARCSPRRRSAAPGKRNKFLKSTMKYFEPHDEPNLNQQ